MISVFESPAPCPLSMQNDPSSVRILRPGAKVSPEPITPTLVSEPELASRCVFGVALETLREDGQTVCGIPLVLRGMVEFLDKNGNLDTSSLLLFLSLSSQCNAILTHSPACVPTESCFLITCRNAPQRSVPSVWLSGADQAAEAAVGQRREGGPGV